MKQFLKSLLIAFCALVAFAPAYAALPAGYTELEYIQSNGTQWINTGIVPILTTGAYVKYALTTLNNSDNMVFGASDAVGFAGGKAFALDPFKTFAYFAFGNFKATDYKIQQGATVNTVYEGTLNYMNSGKATIDNAETNIPVVDTMTTQPVYLFKQNYGGGVANSDYARGLRVYKFSMTNGTSVIQNLIPAKHGNTVGMYDTVTGTFFTNQGTGEFIAGPAKCRNLFDKTTPNVLITGFPNNQGVLNTASGFRSIVYPLEAGKTYTITRTTSANTSAAMRVIAYSDNPAGTSAAGTPLFIGNANTKTATITVPAGQTYILTYVWHISDTPMTDQQLLDGFQIEEGSTATDYVPFCVATIKVATTAYNNNAFSSVQTALNTAVSTIKDVVANTITQTAAIAQIASDKQNRPSSGCPTGKTCLLVEDMNGEPHWYEIIEEYIPPEPEGPEPTPVTP